MGQFEELYCQEDWYCQTDTYICDWYSEHWGVGKIHGRKVDGVWEYALVRWRYHAPSLSFLLRDGKAIEQEDDY